jgi:hypothetical protein
VIPFIDSSENVSSKRFWRTRDWVDLHEVGTARRGSREPDQCVVVRVSKDNFLLN